MPRPRILAVTSELPWPLNTGGKLRTFHIQKALAQACDVRLVVPTRPEQIADIDALKTQGVTVIPAAVPARTKYAEASRLFRARLNREPYAMFGRHARLEVFQAFVVQLKAHQPDVVWLDHIDSLLFHPESEIFQPAWPTTPAPGEQLPLAPKTIIDLHNVYSLILERLAEEASNPLKRWFLKGEAKRMRVMERRAAERCDALLAVSDAETETYRKLGAKAVHAVPNGVDCDAFSKLPIGRAASPLTILFLGTLSWGPNVTAALSLANDIFPGVQRRLPDARLLLVGKDPSPEIALLGNRPGVTVAGSVPSIIPYLEQATLLAVPLDSGGGTRLKILEAFAAGLPVVSTAVGAEGIEAVPGRHIIIAERAAMADAIVNADQNGEALNAMAATARQLAVEKYDWKSIGAKCVEVVNSIHAAEAR